MSETISEPRKATPARVIRNRARHRATSLLLAEYQDRFQVLLVRELIVATNEAAMLQLMSENPDGPMVMLRTGPRSRALLERVDVGRCQRCHVHHDADHTCESCGRPDWLVADWSEQNPKAVG